MPFFSRISLLLFAMVGLAPARVINEKYKSAGYHGSSYFSWDVPGCYYGSNYLDSYIYGSKTKFKTTGKTNYMAMSSDDFSDVYVYFRFESCPDETTLNYLYGYAYESFNHAMPSLFTIETKKLAEASLTDMQVPVYSGSCTLTCYEVCYAEIFEYGTCPPENPVTECYQDSCTEGYEDVANVDIVWSSDDLTPPASQEVWSSRYRSGGSWSMYRSKGQYRYDMITTVSATIDGINILPKTEGYSYGGLGSSTSMDTYKYKMDN